MKNAVRLQLVNPAEFSPSWELTLPAEWALFSSGGTPVGIAGSATQGLQEAFDLMRYEDANLDVLGGGTGAVIICQEGLVVPPLRHQSVRMSSVTIDITPEGDPESMTPGIIFDSGFMVDFFHSGQWVHHGKGRAVEWKPRGVAVPENHVALAASRFELGAVAAMNGGDAVVRLDCSVGPIDRNTITIAEVNGCNDHLAGVQNWHGVEGVGANGIISNRLTFPNIHGCKGTSLLWTLQASYDNRIDATLAPRKATSSVTGAEVGSDNDLLFLGVINNEMPGSALVDVGVRVLGTSNNCYFLVPRNNSAQKRVVVAPGGYRGWMGD